MTPKRPSRRHCNIIRNLARLGHNEDQLARGLGITRETMRGWAKKDKAFADALVDAIDTSGLYWDHSDARARERDERERELAANARKFGHMAHRQQHATVASATRQRAMNGARNAHDAS